MSYRNLDKIEKTITGAEEEDIVEILCDIEQYKELYNKEDKAIYNWMVTSVLKGTAKASYSNKWNTNRNSINTYKKLIKWIYDKFDGAQRVDNKYNLWKSTVQPPNESPRQFYQRYDDAVQSYIAAITYALKHANFDDNDELLQQPTEIEIYRTFINNLNPTTNAHVREYLNIHDIKEKYENVKKAVHYAEKQLNPRHGIIAYNKYNNKPLNTRNYSQRGRYFYQNNNRIRRGRGRGGYYQNNRNYFNSFNNNRGRGRNYYTPRNRARMR